MRDCSDILETLPAESVMQRGGVYGCKRLVSLYCGFREIPWQGKLLISGENWQHGWLPSHHNVHPELALGINGATFDQRETTRFFVARKDQEDYLRQCGYKDVHAIGLPFVYTAEPSVERISGSLLVLPVHGTQGTSHDRQSKRYAEYIKSISHRFSRVCICIHPSDLKKGYWLNEFQEQGLRFLNGANFQDTNALDRMRCLFTSFDFVTTNGFGSHLAYASFCGAKVSIAGIFEENRFEDLANSTFAKNAPEATRLLVSLTNQESVRKYFGEFFIDPWEARTRVEWAKEQLGLDNMRSPAETRRLLAWDFKNRLSQSLRLRLKPVTDENK